ncbi:hypothetical protein ACFOVU_21565 [Nocardiopsis sediminis]|uniref:Uncharacterized protein n=1 Tax=Nocardiopsis sediminis TaxID=1778267 RepID=A0ABV8FTF1_9ACTN
MRTRLTALLGAALAVAATTAPAPAHAGSGSLEMYSVPGVDYEILEVGDGCHDFGPRMIAFADADPIATYVFYSGKGCTGSQVGSGRDDTQWIPALQGVRSVDIRFDG